MAEPKPFKLHSGLRSFRFAVAGLRTLFATQHNVWIHALATVVVCGVAAGLGVSAREWCLLILAMMAVWMTEALNSALEFLADAVTQNEHTMIKRAKDLAAAAVLIAAIGSVFIGVLVLGPHVLRLWCTCH